MKLSKTKWVFFCNSVRSVPQNQYVIHWMEINHGTWISPILNGNTCGDIYYYSSTGVTIFELTVGDYSANSLKSKIPHSSDNYKRILKICSIMQKCIGKDYYSVKIRKEKFEVQLLNNSKVNKLSKYKQVIPIVNYIIVTPRSTKLVSKDRSEKSAFLRLITKRNLSNFFNKSVDDIGKIIYNPNEDNALELSMQKLW